ncbi:MAG TPA: hypothetical protein VIX82_00635 [Solirubrobacteraceae bacterium]
MEVRARLDAADHVGSERRAVAGGLGPAWCVGVTGNIAQLRVAVSGLARVWISNISRRGGWGHAGGCAGGLGALGEAGLA